MAARCVFARSRHSNADGYQEQPAGLILPDIWPETSGVHTYGRTSRFEVIDRLERLHLK